MDQTSSAVFHRNYLSRMIRYHTQATYQGTKLRRELIQAANWMSRLIDPRQPKGPTEEQKANLRQEAEIQALCHHRDQLYHRIWISEFKFLYRAKGQPIHDEYQKAKRAVERLIKAWERALKKQVQAEYDAIASVNDIQAQLEGNAESVDQTVFTSGPVRYAFVERARVAQAFFNPPSAFNVEGDVNCVLCKKADFVKLAKNKEAGLLNTIREILMQSVPWTL